MLLFDDKNLKAVFREKLDECMEAKEKTRALLHDTAAITEGCGYTISTLLHFTAVCRAGLVKWSAAVEAWRAWLQQRDAAKVPYLETVLLFADNKRTLARTTAMPSGTPLPDSLAAFFSFRILVIFDAKLPRGAFLGQG